MTRGLLPSRRILFALVLLLPPLPAEAADSWIEVRSPHFTVKSNAGEKEARKIADQFEHIRQMFHIAFAALRVDPPQPIVIIAAKNENTIKLYLPEEWEVKGVRDSEPAERPQAYGSRKQTTTLTVRNKEDGDLDRVLGRGSCAQFVRLQFFIYLNLRKPLDIGLT